MSKCADCGLLAVRHRKTRELIEADWICRDSWTLPRVDNNPEPIVYQFPVCLARRLTKEHRARMGDGEPHLVLPIIQNEWDCPKFTAWSQGFTPREHQEMINETELRKIEERRRDDDRRFQASQKRWDRAFQIACILIATAVGYYLRGDDNRRNEQQPQQQPPAARQVAPAANGEPAGK